MKKIMIIDDDDSIRSTFKRFFQKHGYGVEVACNGREGLQMQKNFQPDLMITDILMPESDGLEVLMANRNMNSNTPIIAISGGMRTIPVSFLPLAEKLGAVAVLYKPVELDQLLEIVRNTLAEA